MTSLTIANQSLPPSVLSLERGILSPAAAPGSLILGERLEALVIGRYSEQKVRLQLGSFIVTADSQISLNVGDKLTVRVERLFPAVILRVFDGASKELLRIGEFLKSYRANPDALKGLLQEARTLFGAERQDPFPERLSKGEIQSVVRLLGQIVVSKDNVGRPLYLKESLTALGLDFERGLLRTPAGGTGTKGESAPSSLKEVLLKWSAEGSIPGATTEPASSVTPDQGTALRTFVEQALRVIESLQMVNVLAQEQDQLTVLQIPCQCADGIRMQDLFIERDGRGGQDGQEGGYRVVLFVDLDALGTLAVEASLQKGRFQCTIKGPDSAVLDYLGKSLPELEAQLAQLGYREARVQCLTEDDLPAWRRDFLMQYSLYSQSSINVSA